ncbi:MULTISPECIES: iron ABC transporter permease [unclassified Leptolyngbya]|uniref:FecCD family ABC transporter permease n=1 Tax=unclassified Leptolyngbya TaxID=2650499 RepID=UPI001687DC38|nr:MULTISPECIES: iron ABC transporter permease [unclassified Leptolyngbya]MBD1909250.1 iron ABC transporter permease [Leptolyngbya sp. FACHB-8]MBD2156984.1 iron ABC transporter permease [Leptolyngbya sp. FACHB-16]
MTRTSLPTDSNSASRIPLRWLGVGLGIAVLMVCLLLNLTLGAADINPITVWRSLITFDGSTEHLIIQTVRLPRVLIAAAVGAALAVAGALMQGLSRNALADPTILGISSGASLAVVGTTFLFGNASMQVYTWVAFGGAALTAIAVYTLGSIGRQGASPLKLVLAGSVMSYLLAALTTGLLILNQRTLDEVRFWLAGSVAGRNLDILGNVLPYVVVGLLLAFSLGKPMTTLALGEDVARSLGLRTGWTRGLVAIAIVLLAGSSVALAGPIGFVGLIVPHVVRFWVGVDYRWILPYAAIWGAILLSFSDLVARLIIRPQELPVGIMTALVGAPFFIYLARSNG